MMANCNCKNKCGCYGALDALCREHECFYNRPQCRAESDCETCETSAGYPLYFAGNCPGCGCAENTCSRPCGCRRNFATQFIAVPPLIVEAGGRLPLRRDNDGRFCHCHCRCDRYCRERGGRVYLPQEGTYLATYTFLVPPGTQLDTRLALSLDDDRLFASETSVITFSDNGTQFFGGQAVFEADAGSHLALESTAAINIPIESYAFPVATLVIQKLD